MNRPNVLAFALAACGIGALAADKSVTPGSDVGIVVTAEAVHGKTIPALSPQDFIVHQGHNRLPVTSAIALQGEHAGLELFLLVDDSSNSSLGLQLSELKKFIASQPATTAIGIGYMRNGGVAIQQNPTTDHAVAAKALRLPLGNPGVIASPFLALSDLIKRWPASAERHEVIMISSGTDPLGGTMVNPYLDAAIEHAQRSGVIVYTIYTPGAGHAGHSYWRMNWGQNHLAQLAEETGGEAYFLGFEAPVSFAPYLGSVSEHLSHQYLVSFVPRSGQKAGIESINVSSEIPNVELVSAGKVYVPATR